MDRPLSEGDEHPPIDTLRMGHGTLYLSIQTSALGTHARFESCMPFFQQNDCVDDALFNVVPSA